MKNAAVFTIIASLAVTAAAWGANQDDKITPSEAQKIIMGELRAYAQSLGEEGPSAEEYYAEWAKITLKHLPAVRTEGLSRDERLIYGQLLATARKNDEAKAIFFELAREDDPAARGAFKQIIQLAIGEDPLDPSQVRNMLADYRRKFPPSMDDRMGLFSEVRSLARRFNEQGDKAGALAVIQDEMASLGTEKPHMSWLVFYDLDKYMEKEEAVAALGKIKKQFEEQIAARKESSEVPEAQREEYEKETSGWKALAEAATAEMNMLKVMNAPAPGFTFTHFFNTEPIEFSKLSGKVVVLDFWANWCGPCIATFPQMRELFDKYKGTDVQIIGVTGFQGSMANHGEGLGRVADISEEEELKLTKQFLEYHDVTWPVAFSTRNCYDIEYGIQGIPHVVVIDKQGKVRMFAHPSRHDEIIAMIEKLRAE